MLLLDLLPWGKVMMKGKPIPLSLRSPTRQWKVHSSENPKKTTPNSVTSYGIVFIQNVKTMAENLLLLWVLGIKMESLVSSPNKWTGKSGRFQRRHLILCLQARTISGTVPEASSFIKAIVALQGIVLQGSLLVTVYSALSGFHPTH